jgi:DnaJ-class molecular chaperone
MTRKTFRQLLDEALFQPIHMDDQTTQPEEQPIMVTEEVIETNEQVEQTFHEDKAHIEKDPSFNCKECRGEGLLINGSLCPTCKGTGKE